MGFHLFPFIKITFTHNDIINRKLKKMTLCLIPELDIMAIRLSFCFCSLAKLILFILTEASVQSELSINCGPSVLSSFLPPAATAFTMACCALTLTHSQSHIHNTIRKTALCVYCVKLTNSGAHTLPSEAPNQRMNYFN